jgi:hypothetical protein
VPAQQRFRPDREHAPARAPEVSAEGREDEPIARLPGGSLDLAPEDADLVAQREQLDVARRHATGPDQREIDEQPDDRVHERQ